MNARQIISPKFVARVRRSTLHFRVSDAILVLRLVEGMSMSPDEEGTVSEPGPAVVMEDGRTGGESTDKSPSIMPAAISASAATEDSRTSRRDERMSASAQSIALSATPAPTHFRNDLKVGSEPGEPAAAEAKSDTAVHAEFNDRTTHDHDKSRVFANLSAISSAAVASKNDRVPNREDAKVRKATPGAIAIQSVESTSGSVSRAHPASC